MSFMATSLVKRIPLRILFVASLLAALLLVPACGGDDDGGGGPDAATNQPDASPGGALNFMDQCDPQNDQCDHSNGDTCFTYGQGVSYCSHTCTDASDCPAPSTGCSGMGECKRPQ